MLGLRPAVELFNVADDIGESKDLAAAQPELAAAMRAQLDAWVRSMNAQTMKVRADTQ
jgi:hypothetical protein